MNVQNLYRLPVFNGGATSAFGRYPGRVDAAGNVITDFTDRYLPGVVDQFTPIINQLITKAAIRSRVAAGYVNTGQVREYQGKIYLVMRTPTNVTVLVDDQGNEIPFTSAIQTTSAPINPSTGMTTAAIGIGAVVAGLVLFLLLRK